MPSPLAEAAGPVGDNSNSASRLRSNSARRIQKKTSPPTLGWVGRATARQTLEIHLIDGTYELFRHFFALPSAKDAQGREVAAVGGVVSSIQGMIRGGATHVGVATDHIIESFRNELWPG